MKTFPFFGALMVCVGISVSARAQVTVAEEYAPWERETLRLDEPMDGLQLAGPRLQTALGTLAFGEFGALAGVFAYQGERGRAIAFGFASALSLALGVWGAMRLRVRRMERHKRLMQLPQSIAMRQRDVRLTGPRVLIVLGAFFLASAAAIPAYIGALTGDVRAGLFAIPYALIGAPILGLGIRRLRERRRIRARFIGNGVEW